MHSTWCSKATEDVEDTENPSWTWLKQMKGFVSEESVVFIGGEANPFDKVLMLELSELCNLLAVVIWPKINVWYMKFLQQTYSKYIYKVKGFKVTHLKHKIKENFSFPTRQLKTTHSTYYKDF